MQAGELFINLGVKGTEKTVDAFVNVKTGLAGVASTSLEAKAALIGLFYGLERFMSTSATMGTNVLNFNALTGESTKAIQQWGNAAKMAGISANEFNSTVVNLQNVMTNLALGKGPPEMFRLLNQVTGGLDQQKLLSGDVDYMLDVGRRVAKAPLKPGVRNQLLRSIGFGDNFIGPLARGAFDSNQIDKMPYATERQLHALNNVDKALTNIEIKWKMAFANLTSANGGQLLKEITSLSDSLIHLVEALNNLNKATHFLTGLSKILDGASWVTRLFATGVNDVSGQSNSKEYEKMFGKGWTKNILDWRDSIDKSFFNSLGNLGGGEDGRSSSIVQNFYGNVSPDQVKRATEDGYKRSNQKAKKSSTSQSQSH